MPPPESARIRLSHREFPVEPDDVSEVADRLAAICRRTPAAVSKAAVADLRSRFGRDAWLAGIDLAVRRGDVIRVRRLVHESTGGRDHWAYFAPSGKGGAA
jgi:hypothetical protein